jgi:hypothetical protein
MYDAYARMAAIAPKITIVKSFIIALPRSDAAPSWRSTKLSSGGRAGTNEKATSQAILTSLDRLIESARPGDTAVIALSGHGDRSGPRKEWHFCAYDRLVPASDLRARVETLAKKSVRVLLIIDTWESGAIGIQADNIIVLAACAADEAALDGNDSQDNSVYTKALLEGLSGAADTNQDGIVTLAELDAYAAMRVEQLNRWQCPTCGRPANVRSNLPLAKVGVATQRLRDK